MLVYKAGSGFKCTFLLQMKRGEFKVDSRVLESREVPTQVDLRGDQTLQLLYTDSTNTRQVTYMKEGGWESLPFSRFLAKGCLPASALPIASPHMNHFLDLNGDCMIDLAVTSSGQEGEVFLETYLRQSDNLFCFSSSVSLGKQLESLKYIDINQDGSIDLVTLVQGEGNGVL